MELEGLKRALAMLEEGDIDVSYPMELEGLKRALVMLEEGDIDVSHLVTDQHK